MIGYSFFMIGYSFFMIGYSFFMTHWTLFMTNHRFFDRLFSDRLQSMEGILIVGIIMLLEPVGNKM